MDIGTVLGIPRTVGNLRRAQEVIAVLARHGWDDVLQRVGLLEPGRFVPIRPATGAVERTEFERLRLVLEDLGPTFVKLGQVLSYRPDLIPRGLAAEFRRLEDSAPAFDSEAARKMIEVELGRSIDEAFAKFEDVPLAAGSMAQVHVAQLHSGEDVVVKVRRPKLEEMVSADLDVLGSLARLLEAQMPEIAAYRPVEIVEEFNKAIRRELDFRGERRNLEHFAENLAASARPGEGDQAGGGRRARVRVPRVYPEVSSAGVLTTERVRGTKASDRAALIEAGVDVDVDELGPRIIREFARQIFVDRFFHGDPHGGNLLVEADGTLVLIDAGMAGRLDETTRDDLLELMVQFLGGDMAQVVSLLRRARWAPLEIDDRALAGDLEWLSERVGASSLAELSLGDLFSQLLELLARYELETPRALALIGKTVATAEGVARELVPDLRPAEILESYLRETYLSRLASVGFRTRHVEPVMADLIDLGATAPRRISELLRRTAQGDLSVKVDHRVDRVAERERIQASNRLALAIAVAGALVGGSMLIEAGTTVARLVGWAAIASAVSGGLLLAFGFLRSGRF